MNRFGISNKSMLDTLLLLNTFFPPTGDIMKILVLHNHNQYQYQLQNQKKKKKMYQKYLYQKKAKLQKHQAKTLKK